MTKRPRLTGNTAFHASCTNLVGDGMEHGGRGFLQPLDGCFAVNGVNHHLAGTYAAEGSYPGQDVGIRRIIDTYFHCIPCLRGRMSTSRPTKFHFARHKHGLHDDVAVELAKILDDVFRTIARTGTIHKADVIIVDGVEFLDVVVHTHQGFAYSSIVGHRSIREHTDTRIREILIAQADGIVDDAGKFGMKRRFAVSGKGYDVESFASSETLAENIFKSLGNGLTCGARRTGGVLAIEATLAINTIKGAEFSVGWHQIDTERDPEATALHRTEHGGRIKYS